MILQTITNTVIIVVGAGGTIAFFIAMWRGGWRFLKSCKTSLNRLKNFLSNAEYCLKEIFPPLLESLSEKGLLPKDAPTKWAGYQTEKGFTTHDSPLELTEEAQAFLTKIGFLTILDNDMGDLLTELERRRPETAYDVQQQAIDVMIDKYRDSRFIKGLQYNQPEINIWTLFGVGGLYLRDKYLAAHPGITSN